MILLALIGSVAAIRLHDSQLALPVIGIIAGFAHTIVLASIGFACQVRAGSALD